MKNVALSIILSFAPLFVLFSQTNDTRVITTAMPLLLVSPDARAAGLGDQGAATTPDAYSQYWNPSKYAFADENFGIGISYTPYLSRITNDINLIFLSFYSKLNDRSAYGLGLRYFGLGTIDLRTIEGAPNGEAKPNEFALDASYAMQLSPHYSMAVSLRFVVSDLNLSISYSDATAAKNMAFDISGYYNSYTFPMFDAEGRVRLGYNIMNLGPKLRYFKSDEGDFMPANLKLGGQYDYIMDEYNTLTLSLETNKLLVPTPPVRDDNGNIIAGKNDDVSWMQGVFQSFYDAPGGLSEEIKEFTWSAGLEYSYLEAFKVRAGYFHESEIKGKRQYLTLGLGIRYNYVNFDVSYLFSTAKIHTPLDGTMRFSLSFFLDKGGSGSKPQNSEK